MTVKELANLIEALPEDCDDWPVMLGGGSNLPEARVWIVVPEADDDPASPRVEIRSTLVYRAPNVPDRNTGLIDPRAAMGDFGAE